jgi:hypothetical protein
MASRYCDGAQAGEILLSPPAAEAFGNYPLLEACSIPTKHEGQIAAFRVHYSAINNERE